MNAGLHVDMAEKEASSDDMILEVEGAQCGKPECPPHTSSDETIKAVEELLGPGVELEWKSPPRAKPVRKRKDDDSEGGGSQYSSGPEEDSCSSENVVVLQPWCFVLVQPGMADRWKVMYPREAPRLWVLDPANSNPLWYRLPVARVQSAIRRIQPLTPITSMVGVYFRRAARLMSCYLVGDPAFQNWQEIQCDPDLQSPDPREHVFPHLLAVPGSLEFRILEFGAVENPRTGAVTIRVATYISSASKWGRRRPEMTTAGRRIEAAGTSSAPAGSRNVGQFISSCLKGGMVYIAIVTPPSGSQEGVVEVWVYSWQDKVFAQNIGASGWNNDPTVGKAVWETFQVMFDYESKRLMIWAGWTEDEWYNGRVNGIWRVSRFGRLKLDLISSQWVLDRMAAGSKVREATLYFGQPCYASGAGRDVQVIPGCNGEYVSNRKSNYGEIGFEDSRNSIRLRYPPDEYLAAVGAEKAAECVCIGSFRPTVKDTRGIRQMGADEDFPPLLPQTWGVNTLDTPMVDAQTQSVSPLLAAHAQPESVPPVLDAHGQTESVSFLKQLLGSFMDDREWKAEDLTKGTALVAAQRPSLSPVLVANALAALDQTESVPPVVADGQTQSVPPVLAALPEAQSAPPVVPAHGQTESANSYLQQMMAIEMERQRRNLLVDNALAQTEFVPPVVAAHGQTQSVPPVLAALPGAQSVPPVAPAHGQTESANRILQQMMAIEMERQRRKNGKIGG